MSVGSEDSRGTRGNVVYLHELTSREKKDGNWVVHEEMLVHGDRGLSFKYYHKEGNSIEKITGRQNPDGTFILITTINGEKETRTLSQDQLVKDLSKLKHMKYATDYIKTQKGSQGRQQARSTSRRRSRSRGRNRSRSRSRSRGRSKSRGTGSRRGSRKGSRKGSSKGSSRRRSTTRNRRNSRRN